MGKYTKGNWIVVKSGKVVNDQDSASGKPVCALEIRPMYVTEEEYKANAKLIAAAPELLSALEEVIKMLDNNSENVKTYRSKVKEQAMAAINAATDDKMSDGGTVKKPKGRPKKTKIKKRKRFDSNI